MPELYYFNPFQPLIERGDESGILLGSSQILHLPDTATQCRSAILHGMPVTMKTVVGEIGNHTTRVLLDNHVLIDYDPHDEGLLSRTRGLLSLSGNESQLVTLARSTVLVLGAGAIGSHVAWILAAHGIGGLIILDDDVVEESNLNRQLLYTHDDIGRPKVEALADHLAQLRADLRVTAVRRRLMSTDQLRILIRECRPNGVIKALDTPSDVTQWINTACVEAHVPYTTGGFVQLDAIVGPTYVPGLTPCLNCYDAPAQNTRILAGRGGTSSSVTEFTAALVADEILRSLTGRMPVENGRMTVRHGATGRIEHRGLDLVAHCPVCGAHPDSIHDGWWRELMIPVWAIVMCALPFLITLPVWTAPMTLGYWGLCALLTLALPRTNRSAIVAVVAIVYAALNFAITLRFNAALLRVTHLPLIIAVARTVVDFVIMSCLAAMIFVVLAAAVQGIENAVRRLIRSAHPGQEVSA